MHKLHSRLDRGPKASKLRPAYLMSDTSDAVVRRVREEFPTIDAACRRLERLVDPSEAESAVAFAEIFLSKASKEFHHERSADTLAHVALGAWRFLEDSQPDRVDVQVFNPEVDNEGWYAPVTVLRTSISERPFIVDSLREFLHEEELSIEYLRPKTSTMPSLIVSV